MAQVSIVRCTDYVYNEVYAAVRRSIDLIGGIERFVKKGERILIKPNLLAAHLPEEAITTHPYIVKAIIQLVREAGAIPLVGDSPGSGDLKEVAEKTGIMDILKETGTGLMEFTTPKEMGSPDGVFKKLELAKEAFEVDGIINVPKLKTHVQMFLTLSVKNLFGCIIGREKALWHMKAGTSREHFASLLIELSRIIKPRLNIIDAITGLEGDGPGSAGEPRRIGLIITGADPIAVDTVVCKIVGVKERDLPTLRVAMDKGIGETSLDRIEILGDRIEEARVSGFKFPQMVGIDFWPRHLPISFKSFFFAKPVEDRDLCNLCRVCIEACPPQIIGIKNKRLQFDYNQCIRCFCCLEVCPTGAMKVKPAIGRGLLRFLEYI